MSTAGVACAYKNKSVVTFHISKDSSSIHQSSYQSRMQRLTEALTLFLFLTAFAEGGFYQLLLQS